MTNPAKAIVFKRNTELDFAPRRSFLKELTNIEYKMARIRSGTVNRISQGNPDRAAMRAIRKGQWKWTHQERANRERLGPDPHTQDGLGRRKQESNWWMMVNLNKKPKTDTDADTMVKAIAYSLSKIRNNPINWGPVPDASIFKWGPSVGCITDSERKVYQQDALEPTKYIESLEIEAPVAEIGPNKGRLHAHFQLFVTHFSMIHLDCKAFAKIFAKNYADALNRERVPMDSYMRVTEGKSVLIWARLSAQKNAHTWMHKYASKGDQ